MSSEDEEKELNRRVYKRLFGAGFFKPDANTAIAITNLRLVIQALIDIKEQAGDGFLYAKRLLELFIETIERFQRSPERSFNALTLT